MVLGWRRRRRDQSAEMAMLRDRLRQTVEALPGSLVLCGPQRQLLNWNSRYAAICGEAFVTGTPALLEDAIRGSQSPDMPPEERARDLALRLARHDDPDVLEYEHRLADGSWLRLSKRHLPNGEVLSFGTDITALKEQQDHLAARDARYQAMLQLTPAGLWEVDEAGRTLMGNAQLAAMFGGIVPAGFNMAGLLDSRDGTPARLDAQDRPLPSQLDLPDRAAPVVQGPAVQGPAVQGADDRARGAGGQGYGETDADGPDPGEVSQGASGSRRLLLTASGPLPRPEGGHSRLLSLLDITEQHLAQAEAAHLARHDVLTGLENPLRFQTLLAQALASGVTVALLSIELPGIGRMNEQYGHAAGDAALRAAAGRLRQSVRGADSVFRLSGSKFGVLALNRDPDLALGIAERLHDTLSVGFRLGGLEVLLEPCIGMACAPELRDPEALRRAANLARQESLRLGGRPVVYTEALGEAALLRRRLRDALPDALRAGELRLAWQPQRDPRDRRLIGAEALLRWRSSALGRDVPPAEFLPAAAKIGLLPVIDAWVLETALATKRGWAGRPGAPPVIAINISTSGLRDPDFVRQVAQALLRHGLLARELEIEISEDVPASDLDILAPNLRELAELGVQLALDDFGAGASSLAHLVRLPVTRVKLDRSIVGALPGGVVESAILRAALALARSLNIEVLAEGVETDLQAAALRREGCTAVQGWLYGRPMEADALVPPALEASGAGG